MDLDWTVSLLTQVSTAASFPPELLDVLQPVLASLLTYQFVSALHYKTSPLTLATRAPLLRVLERLSEVDQGASVLAWRRWLDLAVGYGEKNASTVKRIVEASATANDGAELSAWELEGVRMFEEQLGKVVSSEGGVSVEERLEWIGRLARCLFAAACASPLLALPLGRSQGVMRSCVNLYDSTIPSLASASTRLALRTRLHLLQAFAAMLDAAYLDQLAKPASVASDPRSIVDQLVSLLALSKRPSTGTSAPKSLHDLSLLGDLEFHTSLSSKLRRLADRLPPNGGGLALRELAQTVSGAVPPGTVDGRLDLPDLLPAPSGAGKGKGKGRGSVDDEDEDQAIATLISRVREVLPEVDEPAVAAAYKRDPALRAGGSEAVEKVLAAALDGTLATLGAGQEPVKAAKARVERRNVFGEAMDANLLRRGKATATADSFLADKSHMTESIRQRIIARAEAPSSDDEDPEGEADEFGRPRGIFGLDDDDDAEKGKRVVDIFDSDYEDPDLGPMPSIARRAGDSSSSSDSEEEPIAPGSGFTPSVEKVLHQAYVSDVGVFEKKARGSAGRKALREKVGDVADDLLEAWKVMFDRDPRRDKILARYEFSGNKPLPTESTSDAAPSTSNASRGQGRGSGDGRGRGGDRGRGGRGRGRGGGKAAHDRRVRGHDKKMVRMGAGPS